MTNAERSWATSFLTTPPGRFFLRAWKLLQRARTNPDAFVEFCFADPGGRPLRQAAVHRELQAFLSAHQRALVELPRDHGKSTQVCARLAWELGRDPSLRVKVVCASEALAVERGRFVREAIVHNARLRLVFPDLEAATPWTDTRFAIVRPANVIGPSVTAIGVGAASTGARADLLICDDIVDVKALRSRAERDRVKAAFRDNLLNLLEPTGRFWGLCTPWHRDDLNAELKKNPAFAVFRRAVREDLAPVWPERWPTTALEARQAEIGAVSFARGYRLVAMSDETQAIPLDWVRYWDEPREADRVVLAVDPALSTKSSADRSALVVLAKCGDEIRCLAAIARRVSAPRLVTLIEALDAEYGPDVIVFEGNGAFSGMAEMMRTQTGFGPKVKTVTNTKDKLDRVSTFSVPVENGKFRLKGRAGVVDPGQQALLDEMTSFPLAEHDDLVDAAAMGTAYLLTAKEPRIIG
jgi:predicted phage terminase large subunit-like protein